MGENEPCGIKDSSMNGRDAGVTNEFTMECMLTQVDLKSPECFLNPTKGVGCSTGEFRAAISFSEGDVEIRTFDMLLICSV
jgi:hypothetical protein